MKKVNNMVDSAIGLLVIMAISIMVNGCTSKPHDDTFTPIDNSSFCPDKIELTNEISVIRYCIHNGYDYIRVERFK